MKTSKKIHDYKSKFNTTDDAYIELIGELFVNHESLIGIKKSWRFFFEFLHKILF